MLAVQSAANRILIACICALFISVVSVEISTRSFASPTENSPELVVSKFYTWYLQRLINNQDPLHDEPVILSKYVSRALVREIEKKANSPDGLEADYFIQAQDYILDWKNNISVMTARIDGLTATAAVTLGATTASRHRLAVSLVKEQGSWKIRRIASP